MHASYFRLTSRLACFVQYAVHLILLGVIDCVEDAQARMPEKKNCMCLVCQPALLTWLVSKTQSFTAHSCHGSIYAAKRRAHR